MPQESENYEYDIIDEILQWENSVVISPTQDGHHTDKCKDSKTTDHDANRNSQHPPISKCCQT